MGENGAAWRLYAGDALIARLHLTEADFPWLYARVEPLPGFDALRPLFAHEWELSRNDREGSALGEVYDQVRAAVSLANADDVRVPEFLLHIDGATAWWRWSDTPFEE